MNGATSPHHGAGAGDEPADEGWTARAHVHGATERPEGVTLLTAVLRSWFPSRGSRPPNFYFVEIAPTQNYFVDFVDF